MPEHARLPEVSPPSPADVAPAATYYASVSWLNVEGEEGQASNPSTLAVAAGNALVAQSVNQPANATAWNSYVGLTPTTAALQNPAPLALDQVWVQSGPVSALGQAPGSGQAPDYLRALPRVIQRG